MTSPHDSHDPHDPSSDAPAHRSAPQPIASERLAALRREYTRAGLSAEDLGEGPLEAFGRWLGEAVELELPEATACTLATASAAGRPSARIVLLKGYGPEGFSFFTNYESRKGRELAENPWASLVFYWPALERQVRIEGRVERLAEELSDAYFAVRPRGSRVGAWASPQSRPIADRQVLEDEVARIDRAHGETLPRPPHWGGYLLVPDALELWQGRESRLHDRFRFERTADPAASGQGGWTLQRLAP